MTNTDDELLSETDVENVARMERMLRERGYVRHLGGFWIDAAMAAKVEPQDVATETDE
jgi:hypothetical protein